MSALVLHGPEDDVVLEVDFVGTCIRGDGAQLVSLTRGQRQQCLQTGVRVEPLLDILLLDVADFLSEATTREVAE